MGKGQYVRLGFSGSLERAQVDFSFTEPHFLDRNLAAGFDLFHKEVDFTNVASYRERNTGGNLRMGFPIAFNTQLGLRYRLEREEIYDVANNASLAVKAAEGESIVSSVGFTVAYDTRNLPQSPTSGVFASFSEDLAGVGGDVNYFRSVVDGRGYYPVTHQDHLGGPRAGRLHHGMGRRGRPHDGPLLQGRRNHQRLRARGHRSPRRLRRRRNRQAGEDCSKDPLGGQAFWATTAELRFPLPFVPDNLGMQGAVFVDAGSLWEASGLALAAVDDEGSFINDTADVRMSTGVSIIWQSPLGPLRADLAQALLKASYDRTELFRFGASTAF